MIINPYLVQPSGPSYDADAQAFFTAAGITDTTQKSAVNQLVLDLKSYSIWTKMTALYPFVGGTSTTHSYNLKDTAQYQITWYGGITHNSNGVTGNGTNGYGNTNLNYTTLNSGHQSLYSRSAVTESGAIYDMGAFNGGNTWQILSLYTNASLFIGGFNSDSYPRAALSNSSGFFMNNRTASNAANLWRSGTKQIQSTQASSAIPNINNYICSLNNGGSALTYSAKNYAFASIGDGLDDTEAANFYTAVQAFQTTLSRNV
jgi:hypothetical protein